MKLNPNFILPLLLSLYAVGAFADTPEFQNADKNKDGVLSISEAKAALPELEISDDNGDGLVNHAEVEKSVSGLDLPAKPQFDSESEAPVGMSEYRLIVQAMQMSETDA